MAQGKSSPTSVPKQGNKLDNMLGSLQSDLNRLGVQTVAKGVCGACKKPIAGQVRDHRKISFNAQIIFLTYIPFGFLGYYALERKLFQSKPKSHQRIFSCQCVCVYKAWRFQTFLIVFVSYAH